ncbi:MAG: ATP-binding protein [Myxococcota bacterium]
MARLRGILGRVERLLGLAEHWLRSQLPEPADPRRFEEVLAFRWEARHGPGHLVAIPEPALFDLDDLRGVALPLERLVANTEQFLEGLPSNHVLLFGERGTGKSSAVRGLLGRFGSRGLRIVEVHKDDLLHLPDVLDQLRPAPQRFLIYCDDLSFDAGETRYRELKAALEGSLAAPPANVLIVATSNRRHLLPERMEENLQARLTPEGELRMGEALDEKLALSDRFGLVLGFFGFDQDTYLSIVEHYAKQAGLRLDSETLRAEALRFALERSTRSGRTARQFVDDLAGRETLGRQRS